MFPTKLNLVYNAIDIPMVVCPLMVRFLKLFLLEMEQDCYITQIWNNIAWRWNWNHLIMVGMVFLTLYN